MVVGVWGWARARGSGRLGGRFEFLVVLEMDDRIELPLGLQGVDLLGRGVDDVVHVETGGLLLARIGERALFEALDLL
jgi:hypothetical protein